ncbi:solute carrier organic anion transporter family member 3A1-like, partial [Limulus polyphemus]|uniref:Solute carrier organic anion transporter family member 3A1-like n=1 Tax=Limulus polyphemus TaxID=6850 RepID=A0ABM1TS46_LIMPO
MRRSHAEVAANMMNKDKPRNIGDESKIVSPNGNESKTVIVCSNHNVSNGTKSSENVFVPNDHHADDFEKTLSNGTKSSENVFVPNDHHADDFEKPYCGIGSFRPKCFQSFANKKTFVAIFCFTSVLQGMYSTYFVSVLTTIEKLYRVESKTTGIILSATEIGQIGGAFFLTYYGGRGHRPKWIAFGTLLFATACIFCSTPHFLFKINYPVYTDQDNAGNQTYETLHKLNAELCRIKQITSSEVTPQYESVTWTRGNSTDYFPAAEPYGCGFSDVPNKRTWFVLTIFFISLLFIGIGATAVYTLGIPYIDDNVAARDSPMYFAITIGVRIFGPVFGFLLGSFCIGVYVNFPFETAKHLTPDDPQWIGAWWLGLCMVGGTLFLSVFPMASFPRKLPKSYFSAQRQVALMQLNGQLNGTICNNNEQEKALLGEHNVKKNNASTWMAGILVMGVGIFFSGTLMRRFKPSARIVAAWITLAAFAYCLGMVVLMWVGCPVNIRVSLFDV